MACDTCVVMTHNAEAILEEQLRLKRTNRIMRTVNSMLRRDMQLLRAGADDVFLAFCETSKASELAMGELWGSGAFDCGPQDYDYIVERCLAAMREYNERRTHPPQV